MEVNPAKQNIMNCFDENYHIDFYQREYKWGRTRLKG